MTDNKQNRPNDYFVNNKPFVYRAVIRNQSAKWHAANTHHPQAEDKDKLAHTLLALFQDSSENN